MRKWVAIASCAVAALIPAAAEARQTPPPASDKTPSAPTLAAPTVPTTPAADQPATQQPLAPRPNVPPSQALAANYVPCRQSTYPGDPWSICRDFGIITSLVMRWGDATWGYRHIRDKHGYGQTTDNRIFDTLFSGDIEVQGTTRIYRKNSYGCRYKVVYQTSRTQGVITAYCVG